MAAKGKKMQKIERMLRRKRGVTAKELRVVLIMRAEIRRLQQVCRRLELEKQILQKELIAALERKTDWAV